MEEIDWLEKYRAFNNELARRLAMGRDMTQKTARLAIAATLSDEQVGKLFAHRLHELARVIGNEKDLDVHTRAHLMYELAELADQIEERLSK